MIYFLNPNILPKVNLINMAKIEPPYIHRRRKADEYILYIIKNGVMYLKENGVNYTLKPGDTFMLDPDYVHEGFKTSCCEYYYIHFRHSKIWRTENDRQRELTKESLTSIRNNALQSISFSYESYETEKLLLPKLYHFTNQSSFIMLQYLLNEAIEQNKIKLENYKIQRSCKVLELMIQIEQSYISAEIESIRQGSAKSLTKAQEILNYINADYAENFSGIIIEERFDGNFDYLNRIFKRVTGNTIFAYLTMVRISHAKELISTTSLKLSEIGEKVGIPDVYYFSKVFKKLTGVSPTVYGRGILKK